MEKRAYYRLEDEIPRKFGVDRFFERGQKGHLQWCLLPQNPPFREISTRGQLLRQ